MTALFGPGGNGDAFKLFGGTSTVQAPRFVSEFGLDAYEYEAGNGIASSPAMLTEIGIRARENNIKLSFHAPYFISLSSIDEQKRLNSIRYIAQSIDAAHLLGADIIVVHTGSASKISRDEAMGLATDTLARTLSSIDTRGIKIGLETMGKKNQLGTLDEVLELCRIDSTLVPVVDFGHMNARELGNLFITQDDYMRVFDKIGSCLGAEIATSLHCHFSRIEWTEKGEKKHLTFSDTEFGPDFRPLMEVIAKNSLTPTIICESAGTQAEDALTMKKYYKEFRK